MAVGTDTIEYLLAPLERRPRLALVAPLGDEARMVDLALVGSRFLSRQQQRIGGQFRGAGRAPFGHRGQVGNKVEELLPVGEQIDEPCRHE